MELETLNRLQLIEFILAGEWQMFQRVKGSAPAACQSNPQAFTTIRGSIFEPWPKEMLVGYARQLACAATSGRNLLTEKYARMDNLIPPLSTSPLLDKIVDIEAKWQTEIRETYPALYARVCRATDEADDGSNFSVYLRAELETYGDEVIALYHDWVNTADSAGTNLSMTMLLRLVERGGFASLAQAEQHISGRIAPATQS